MRTQTTPTPWSRYVAASAAILAVGATSEAAIVYFPLEPDITGSAEPDGSVLQFNFAGEAGAPGISSPNFTLANVYKTAEDIGGPADALQISTTAAAVDQNPLGADTLIGAGQPVNPSSASEVLLGDFGTYSGTWTPGQRAYLGLRFDINDSFLYGWADLTATSTTAATLHSFAYEDSGAPIAAGAVPEPSQAALLALGAAGMAGLRSRSRSRKN